MARHETFSSRWALILAALGMVIGTGNIWRFPRIVAKNGGGAFLVAWFLFLFLWSIPLLIGEFSIGKYTRKGTIGAFAQFVGPKFAWMGGICWFLYDSDHVLLFGCNGMVLAIFSRFNNR